MARRIAGHGYRCTNGSPLLSIKIGFFDETFAEITTYASARRISFAEAVHHLVDFGLESQNYEIHPRSPPSHVHPPTHNGFGNRCPTKGLKP